MPEPDKIICLIATLNPIDQCWQLPLANLKDTAYYLIGWVHESRPVDAGVPDMAASIILNSILKRWNVTFFDKIIKSTFNPFKKKLCVKACQRSRRCYVYIPYTLL